MVPEQMVPSRDHVRHCKLELPVSATCRMVPTGILRYRYSPGKSVWYPEAATATAR
jgi:hypothetical protein